MSNESNRSKHGGSQPIGAVYARCAVYARFSSDLQRDASTQDQFRNCRGLAARKNWNVVDEYVRSDEGISGASLEDRKGLLELIAAAKQRPRPFDRLLVDDTSRLARNLSEWLKHWNSVVCTWCRRLRALILKIKAAVRSSPCSGSWTKSF